MKIAFKVMSVLLIIWSGIQIVNGVRILMGSEELLDAASGVGGSAGAVAGAVGSVAAIISIIGIIVYALMLYTGINGVRGIISKCRKYTMGFIIFSAIVLVFAIKHNTSVPASFLELMFLIVYYVFAKKYSDTDSLY